MNRRTAILPALLVLLALPPHGSRAAEPERPLGRLFLSAEARAALERQEAADRNGKNQPPRGRRLQGSLKRNDGPPLFWVDGRRGSALPDIQVGDALDPATGQRRPLLGTGRLTVHRPPP